jgi:hypothetical protein
MSNYDIAAGATQDGLNSLLSQLYAVPSARNGLFKGTVTQNVDLIGSVTVTYDITQVPTILLVAPTAAQWASAQKHPSDAPIPTANAFQVLLPNLAGTASVGGAAPVAAAGPVTIFGTATVTAGVATLIVQAVGIDESNFSAWDVVIVNDVLLPLLFDMANKLLAGLPLPQVPSFAGLTFQPLAVLVGPQGLLVGTSLVGGAAPDLSGFAWALASPLFFLTSLNALNQVFVAEVNGTQQLSDSTGPSGWTASGRVTATNLTVSASIDTSPSPSSLMLSISGTFACYGELSGTGVGVAKAVLCPIGAAADAISNPSGWNKVDSNFQLNYSPNPMPFDVALTAAAPAGTPPAQDFTVTVSDNLPSSFLITVQPTWSGSVTGTVLAAAASAFVDLITSIFGKLIIKKVLQNNGTKSFSLPSSAVTKTISLPNNVTVTLALSAPAGNALQPFGTDQLSQLLNITIS